MRSSVMLSVLAGVALAGTLAVQVRAGGDLIKFPEDYAKGKLFATVDRPDNKQYREFYTSQAALDAVQKGQAVPSGTVITMVQYKAKLGADGNPEKNANGKFIKDKLVAYAVMQKVAGWGAEYPEEMRNGEWEYQVFNAEKQVNDKANLKACFACHKPKASSDYLFTLDQLKAAAN